jgi:diaminopimelate epimerase
MAAITGCATTARTAEMCGNGAGMQAGWGSMRTRLTFETMAGRISAELVGEQVKIRLTQPYPF